MLSFRQQKSRILKRLFAASVAVLLFQGTSAMAQQPDANARMAALEARIADQEKLIQNLLKERGIVPVQASTPPDSKEVEKVVKDILKANDDKKKADEEARKKEADAAGTEVGSDLKMNANWKNGLWLENADKSFRIHFGGRTQLDADWIGASKQIQFAPGGIGQTNDGVNFRRCRFAAEGTIWEVMDFNFEYDFLNNFNAERTGAPLSTTAGVPTDMWITFTHLPFLGNVRVGNQKPFISFEHLTSSRWLNMIERSFAFDAFIGGLDNGFRPGISTFNTYLDERMTFAAGFYKNNTSILGFNAGDGEYDFTTRATLLPIYENDGRCLLHFGLGYSHRDLDDDQVLLRARILTRNGPATTQNALASIRLNGNSQDILVPEMAFVWGPFSMQAEYFAVQVTDAIRNGGPANQTPRDVFYHSAYVEFHYFLTGEHRPYNKKIGAFDRVIPHENFFMVRTEDGPSYGLGAWQLTARLGYINLNDQDLAGGYLWETTAGINWYLNPNMKLQMNYTHHRREGVGTAPDGDVNSLTVRAAIDF